MNICFQLQKKLFLLSLPLLLAFGPVLAGADPSADEGDRTGAGQNILMMMTDDVRARNQCLSLNENEKRAWAFKIHETVGGADDLRYALLNLHVALEKNQSS